jgi:DNA-binding HxlR family transcriptional regulator
MSRKSVAPDASDLDARREMLAVATQETRFTLVQGIVGHPEGLPSLAELVLLNPSLSRSTIHEHLQKLVSAGVVERVENPDNDATDGLPTTFYGLTEAGREVLRGTGLFEARGTLRHFYDSVEKTDEHLRYEQAPRP